MKRPHTSDPFDAQTLVLTACHGKQAFASRQAAQRVVDARRRNARFSHNNHKQRKSDLAALAPYHCGHCGQWHLGGRKK